MDTLDPSGVQQATSFPDPDDPILYPQLTPGQLELVSAFATPREYAAGELLFDQGVRDAPLFVLEAGSVQIIDRRTDGDLCVARVGAGNFLGDIAMFTGQPTVVACVADRPTQVLAVDLVPTGVSIAGLAA